jgi:hypothetical protein
MKMLSFATTQKLVFFVLLINVTLLSTIYTNVGLHVKCPIFCPISTTFVFSRLILIKLSSVTKIRPVEAELIHMDRHDEASRR